MAEQSIEKHEPNAPTYAAEEGAAHEVGQVVNASGHVQELDRQFSLLSACSVGICTGNTWAALGGAIVISMYNGGPPGVLYEFLAVSVFYWMIAACIAELASAIPSSAGVYHWATVTAGRYGRPVGYFAGWWNFLAWVLGVASLSAILANQVVSMYALYHVDYVFAQWHSFIAYLIITWLACCLVLFANRVLPLVSQLGLFFILAGVLVTVLVCAIMPSTTGSGHAATSTVFRDWQNLTGYESNGLVFLLGMLNGAFSVGVPDCVSHLAEEIPNPRVNVPKAIAAQMLIGLLTAVFYLIAIFYAINDLEAVFTQPYTSPLAELYRQATNSTAGSAGLIVVVWLPTLCTLIGAYITAGRMLWTLARDRATPFPNFVGKISAKWKNPFNATLVCGCISTLLACIYVGSPTAFNAFVGSFVILSSISYLSAILPHVLSRRRHVVPGPFWMPDAVAYTIGGISCVYIIVFAVLYCFPYSMPVSAATMNYACLITGGLTVFVAGWWLWIGQNGYEGPKALVEEENRLASTTAGEARLSSDKI